MRANDVVEQVGTDAADGRSTRWEGHRVARRTELTHAARRAVHRRGPDLSMDEIASELGTSKSILYRYFGDKVGLQNAVGEAVVEAIRATLAQASEHAPTPRASLEAMVRAYLQMIEHSPSVYYFVTRNAPVANSVVKHSGDAPLTAQQAPLSDFMHSVVGLVARPFAEEVGSYDTAQVDAWAAGAVGFVTGTGEWWLSRRGSPTTPDAAHVAAQITAWLWVGPGGGMVPQARTTP